MTTTWKVTKVPFDKILKCYKEQALLEQTSPMQQSKKMYMLVMHHGIYQGSISVYTKKIQVNGMEITTILTLKGGREEECLERWYSRM